jgi:molecular chaperone HscB
MNHFELFDLPITIKIDKQLLSEKYFSLQKKYHPDFYTLQTEFEQSEALALSSQVNKAYKIFRTEDETIKYLLELKGVLQPDEKFVLPPDFLMEVMELNENLGDDNMAQIEAFAIAIYADVKLLIDNYNDATVTPIQLQQLKAYHFKKKYLQRILDRTGD